MKRGTVIITGAAAAAMAVAGLGVARQHRRLAAVAPELRSRMLYLPVPSVRSERSLRIGRRLLAQSAPVAPGVQVRTERVSADGDRPEVPVVVYERPDRSRPSGALLWVHGGGLVMGTPAYGHDVCSRFADLLGVFVVSVDYRLAPESPFPAGLEDCAAALAWVHDQAEVLGVDPARVAIGGDSAGGGLAACLAQLAHDRGGPAVCFQLLQYPMLDDRTGLAGDRDAIVWTAASNRYAWSAYLGHPAGSAEDRPYASAARRVDLTGLPPAWIGVGEIDLFHDECVDYAARLAAASVPCQLHVVAGMFHGAERFAPSVPTMQGFVDSMTAALRGAIG